MTKRIITCLFTVILFLLPCQAVAGSFSVTPIRVFLDSKKNSSAIKIINKGDEKVTVHVKSFVWSQDKDGADKLEPTKEIIFFPKIFSIDAQGERIVRIGYKGEWPVKEKTYRLFIRELPVKKPGELGLKMALRIGMPVFVSPSDKVEKMAIEKIELAKGKLIVRVKNTGNSHFQVKKIEAAGLDASGKEVFSKEAAGWYVLTGVTKSFFVEISAEECLRSKLIKAAVEVGKSRMEEQLDVARAMCPQ